MKIKDIYESTTSGSVASVAMPLGGTQKREGSMFKGKKTKKKFYEGKVKELMQDLKELSDEEFKKKYKKTKQEWRQALKEDEVNEADLILVPGHGNKLKPGFIPKDKDRTDHEVEMARSDLFHAAQNAKEVYKMIHQVSEDEGLEGWVQEKIIKANDYLNTVREYLEHKTYMQEGGLIAGGMSNFEEGRGGAETSWSNDTDTITLQDILELTKHIKQINLPINDNLKSKLIHWDGNPEEIERINQVTVSKQFPILVMLDGQGQIDWILDGNHRLHKAIQSQAKTIPAKLIKPSDLNDKAKRVFHIKEQGVAEDQVDEEKDACYNKVKSRYKVWPSAYASGALVKCRKVGASNWGNSSKK